MTKVDGRRAFGALLRRDIGCTLRNATCLASMVFAVTACWFFSSTLGEFIAVDPSFAAFITAFIAFFPTLEAGSIITLFAMGEERAHGTYEVMERGGVRLRTIIEAKVAASALFATALTTLCFAVAGAAPERLPLLAAIALVGSLPFLVLSSGCGLLSHDQMRTNLWAWPQAILGLMSLVGTVVPAWGFIGALSPVGFLAAACTWTVTGDPDALGFPPLAMAANLIVWSALSLLWLRCCLKRAERDQS